MKNYLLLGMLPVVGATAFMGCSSDSTPATPAKDAGQEENHVVGGTANQTGDLQEFPNPVPVDGATVKFGTVTGTTNADGHYNIAIPLNTPAYLTISKDQYLTLREQEWQLTGDTDRGPTNFLSFGTRDLLTDTLKAATGGVAIDKTLGLLGLHLEAENGCASTEGATVSISPPGTKAVYFTGSLPNKDQTSVSADAFPSVAFYNVPVNTDITITLTHPTCTQAPFPYTQKNLIYTGKVQALPGDVLTFARAFLKK